MRLARAAASPRPRRARAPRRAGHINNLYNTTFWALVQQGGLSTHAAEQALVGTVASDKHEILFSRFGINYAHEPELLRKGAVMLRLPREETVVKPCPPVGADGAGDPAPRAVTRVRRAPTVTSVDVISDAFWAEHAALFPPD